MTIGFVGLGQMGRPIVTNLAIGGANVVAAARNAQAFDGLPPSIHTTTDLSRLVEGEIVFLCLSNGEAVENVLFGPNGIAAALRSGQLVVDLGTSEYVRTMDISKRLAAADVAFLDAPVSGMEARASAGTLTIMCGGTAAAFALVKPFFELIGERILHMGPTGSGQSAKLINQLLFDINAAALAEILPVAVKLGLDSVQIGEVVNNGTGRSFASEFFIPRILKGHFSDGYPMCHAYKDLMSGSGISADLGLPMPVLAAATATYQTALLRGHGNKDKGGMICIFEELLGVAFRDAETVQGE